MEFKSLKNIETSFRQIRLFTLVFLGLCAVVAVFSVVKSYRFAQRPAREDLCARSGQVADAGPLARPQPEPARRGARARPPLSRALLHAGARPAAIESNINRALFLCDKSAYHYSQDLQEKGYYNRVVAGNINQQVQVDSVVCDFDTYPYRVTTYARQMIIRESNVTERSLVTRCNLINSVRSDNNPQGFTMERFEIVENRDLRVIAR